MEKNYTRIDDRGVIVFTDKRPNVPCSDNEKLVYGVDFKQDISRRRNTAWVTKEELEDSEISLYSTDISSYKRYFLSQEKAEQCAIDYVTNKDK